MRVFLIAASLSIAIGATGCSRDKKTQDGLPPAQEWKADSTGAMVQTGQPTGTPTGEQPPPPPGMANPNAGNPHMGNDPHAGLGMDPSDPHAGLDMSGAGGGGVDVAQLGLPPPDPSRPIDPTRYVKGVIKIHMKAKGRAKPGTPVFIVVKRADASGQPTGTPLAVEKLAWADELPFQLTEAQAMVGGTELTGDVVVSVRYDQDGDALSKEQGDIVGQARVKLPADNVQIWLDTIL